MLSRIEDKRKATGDPDWQPEMPPIQVGGYLLGYLFEAGPVMSGPNGAIPVTHQEIAAWQAITRIPLQPWEGRFLRRLSLAYVSELHEAEKANRPAPWTPATNDEQLAQTADDMRRALRALSEL